MKVSIRQEKSGDYNKVYELIKRAFATEVLSDHTEQILVSRLRTSTSFIPELSIVAENEKEIVGHILLTEIKIKNEKQTHVALALAPVSVLPEYQRKGIGGQLIRYGHEEAKRLGYKAIVLIGHANYYPRFGYEVADKYGIRFPFDAPAENCMVKALLENGFEGISGMVEYPEAFMG